MKNVFVLGADDFNLEQLKRLNYAEDIRFHKLFDYKFIKEGDEIPVREIHEGALRRLQNFEGSVDAIVGYWDFPVSTLLPALRKPFGLSGPTLESVLKCEHKYWSRLEQNIAIPERIPKFFPVNPFARNPRGQIALDYPFWLKPVKSVSSHLGFYISSDEDFDHAIEEIQKDIGRFARPFNYILELARLPEEIVDVDGYFCLAESIISAGNQSTQEGYVSDGHMVIYGTVDSIREELAPSSFSRYQYPSKLPSSVKAEMASIGAAYLRQIDFNNGAFNFEFFWDPKSGKITFLEANTRISRSHAPLFKYVDGEYNHKIMVDLGLGKKPDFPRRQGDCKISAKFMWRVWEDAFVKKVPNAEKIERIKAKISNTEMYLTVREGMFLSDLVEQDSYSYEIAHIFIGGKTESELIRKFERIKREIHPELEKASQKSQNQRRLEWKSSTSSPELPSI